MEDPEALKNSFAAIKRDIDEIKARNSLIDGKLRNSFSNIKRDMEFLKESVSGMNAGREDFISLGYLNERLSNIDASIEAVKYTFSGDIEKLKKDNNARDIKRLEKRAYKDFEGDLNKIKSKLKTLGKAGIKEDDFEKAIDSLKEELDVSSKLKKLEKKIKVSKNVKSDLNEIRSELKALDEARMKNGRIFEKAIDSLKDELDVSSKLKKIEKRISKPVIKEVPVVKEVIKEVPVIKEVIKEVPVKSSKKKKDKGMFTKMIDFFAED